MRTDEFNDILADQLRRITDVLVDKREEYAEDGDVLCNFKAAAALQGCSVPYAIAGMMAKHTVSVYDMVFSNKPHPMEKWDEKITDHINYLILLRAAVSVNTEPPHAETRDHLHKLRQCRGD